MWRVLGIAVVIIGATAAIINQVQEDTIKQECHNLIASNKKLNLVAGIVRLVFHDCVGGCDGCVNLKLRDGATDDKPNAGLQDYIKKLEPVYQRIKETIDVSRADFWVMCAHEAVKIGRHGLSPSTPVPREMFNLKYGRKDCGKSNGGKANTADYEDNKDNFPNPRLGLDATLAWCDRVFGFNATECVAILGAHTLGKCRGKASGYKFPWVKEQKVLDNAYYIDLVAKTEGRKWRQVDVSNNPANDLAKRFQYIDKDLGKKGILMMLNTDMALLKDIRPNEFGNVTSGVHLTDEPDSSTASLVREYALDDAGWFDDFSKAFEKMVHMVPPVKCTEEVVLVDVQVTP